MSGSRNRIHWTARGNMGANMTSFSSFKIALRISSAILSGLAPLAVVASVTVQEKDDWVAGRFKMLSNTYFHNFDPIQWVRSRITPYLCSLDWRTALWCCVRPFRPATNRKMLASHASMPNKLNDGAMRIFPARCSRIRSVPLCVLSSLAVPLQIRTGKIENENW